MGSRHLKKVQKVTDGDERVIVIKLINIPIIIQLFSSKTDCVIFSLTYCGWLSNCVSCVSQFCFIYKLSTKTRVV